MIVKAVIFDDRRVPAGGGKMQARRLQHRGGETLRARCNVPGRGHGIESRCACESAAQPEAVLQPADSARLEQRLESRWAKLGFGGDNRQAVAVDAGHAGHVGERHRRLDRTHTEARESPAPREGILRRQLVDGVHPELDVRSDSVAHRPHAR